MPCIFFVKGSKAQSYGLGFFSHAVEAGKRTTLDIFPGKNFEAKDDFQLAFDLSFLPDQNDYLGYIFHIEGPQKNIEFMYSKSGFVPDLSGPGLFKLVNGESSPKISFNIDKAQIQSRWNKIKLIVDFTHDRLILYVNNNRYIQNNARLVKGTYRFIWGINADNNDIPPMKIRDIKLENNKIKYYWPLNEISGNVVHEIINNQNGSVSNPLWIRAKHHNWALVKSKRMAGKLSVAFNAGSAELYVIGPDSLLTFNLNNLKLTGSAYRSGKQNLPLSNQSVYDARSNKLFNYYVDRDIKQVNSYDLNLKKWDKNYPDRVMNVDYQNANNFMSPFDTSLYIIGGYGHFLYKNEVFRYNTDTKKFSQVKVHGDYFWPRYLAAASVADSGRTAYILGGHGSYTGEQVLSPKNLYDLVKFDIRAKSFKKIYDLKIKGEDFTFANSLIINEQDKTYSTLIFPNNRYNSYLRLLTGHLDKPSYRLIGDSIPYKFHDVNGAANIFYDHVNKQFIAVTMLGFENDETTVNIYTLSAPADSTPLGNYPLTESPTNHTFILWSILIGLAGAALLVVVFIKRKKRFNKGQYVAVPFPQDITAGDAPMYKYEDIHPTKKNAIFLFGEMQLINQQGEDFIKQFTSLLKELFLIILIYTLKSERGISGEKLAELLWADKPELSAKNNRDTNLSRLKSLLNQFNNVSIYKESGNWKINIDYKVIYFDYYHYLQIIADKKSIDKERICQLMEISKRGNFLSGFEYPWLDQMKSEISNDTIDTYLEYAEHVIIEDDPEFLIKVANSIFYLDSVNEEAMIIKCKALSHLGKHSLAKSTFENFVKEFKTLYGEDFKKDFHSVMGA